MNIAKLALASAAILATVGANAAVVGSLGGGTGPFLTLTSGGSFMSGSTTVANEVGGSVLSTTTGSSTEPMGTVGNYLSDLGTATTTVTFTQGVSYLSFLWGTPDTYNQLSVNGTTFTAASLNFPMDNGSSSGDRYVQFMGTNGTLITSLTFSNSPQTNSFETANYSVTPVPEPETYALMLGGLGLVGFIARRRRS